MVVVMMKCVWNNEITLLSTLIQSTDHVGAYYVMDRTIV
jgi:hypothetical protein